MTSVRYMGTKRALGPLVRRAIESCRTSGRVADLFSGMGAIASELAPMRSVLLNEILTFPTVFARAHCLPGTRKTPKSLLPEIYPLFVKQRTRLRRDFDDRLACEAKALKRGRRALLKWMTAAPHVGSSKLYQSLAKESQRSSTGVRYKLATLYFASGYFSTAQAIDLDALRYAIDNLAVSSTTADPLLAVWLSTASRIINAPGHSAQFLKPNNETSHKKIASQMAKGVWETFTEISHNFAPWGSAAWRARNSVVRGDALELIDGHLPRDVGVVYADPPYTKDHYSRFYHAFETLLLYDFPESVGVGRYRSDRYPSPFSHKSAVESAFERLFFGARRSRVPLVLSYPSDGLLCSAGISIDSFVRKHFAKVDAFSVASEHSTMGGSKGSARKDTIENVFVCR
jgi:adenine-specific DNA-methyltransferase